MKKRGKFLLLALALLAAPLAGFALGFFTEQYDFDEIWAPRAWISLPAEPERELTIAAPGPTWEDPDPPASRSRSYHAVMNLLRSRKYRKTLLPSSMEDGGVIIYLQEGCIPSIVAYWVGGKLWVVEENETWRAYVPNHSNRFGGEMETLLKRYKY